MAKEACTGLTASRNNTTMTFTWLLPVGKTGKKGQFRYKLITEGAVASKVKWTVVKLTDLVLMPQTYSFNLDPTQYYPATDKKLVSIIWDVMMDGNKWAGDQTYNFTVPEKPKLTLAVDTFSWVTTQDSGTNNIYFQDVEYQSTNSGSPNSPDWSASSVTSGTGSSTGSQTYSSDNTGYRHFRCRVRGIAGASEWVSLYKSHNAPKKVLDIKSSFNGRTGRGSVSFYLDDIKDLDQALVYYAIDVPASGYSCPPGATWNLAYTVNNPNRGWNSVSLNVPGIALDKAVWVRVDTYNSPNTTQGDIALAGSCGLAAPTITGFSVNTTLHTVTFTFTNNSSVPGVQIGCQMSSPSGSCPIVGTVAGTATTMTCNYGNVSADDINFSLFAYYTLTSNFGAYSDYVTQSIDLSKPLPPTGVTVAKTSDAGKVQISWTNNWSSANAIEISWSDDPDAWDSNLRPNTFVIESAAVKTFLIAGLALGKYWYFRVRSVHLSEDGLEPDVYSPYNSALVPIDLTETPDAPGVWVDSTAIAPGDPVTVHWAYVSNDDTDQQKATIYIDNVATYDVNSAVQSFTFTPNWLNNTTHTIKVSTLSESGRQSSQSSAVSVKVAPALSLTVTSSIVGGQITGMPITVTATGAGTGGKTMISIIRDGHYSAGRPDGDTADGFDGETIYTQTFMGAVSGLSIEPGDLVGRLDDGCYYKLVVAIASSIGQTAQSVTRFLVAWSHQPEVPTATVTEITGGIAKINVSQPSNYVVGDFFQVYRLSKDKPELIIDGGIYATDYVDPYPAARGGYRIVNVTLNGDYIGPNYPAWVDMALDVNVDALIIDFDDNQLDLPYNLTLNSTWNKDFERTVYLNGSIQGDWNRGTTMDGSVGTVTLKSDDDRIEVLRELAVYPGICHVRTPDGASYAADVQVKQSGDYSSGLASFDLTIHRVDPEGNEGYLKSDWDDMQG